MRARPTRWIRRGAPAACRALLLTAVVAAASGTSPAAAHVCPVLVAPLPIGRAATVTVAVTVEDATVPDVELVLPPALQLDAVAPEPGWKATRAGSTVRYRGGPIRPFGCGYFTITVASTAKGINDIVVVERDAHGVEVARPVFAVYVGVKPPEPPGARNFPVVTVVGAALVGLGAAAMVVRALLSWRQRRTDARAGARAAELDSRIDAFSRAARDRRAPPGSS
jgi:hypothetical protein